MGDKPKGEGSSHLQPAPPPEPTLAQSEVAKAVADPAVRTTQLEVRVIPPDRELTAVCQPQTEMSNIRTEFADLKSRYSRLETDHKQLTREHTKLQRELSSVHMYLEAFQADHSELKMDQIRLKKKMDSIRDKHQTEIDSIRDKVTEIDSIRDSQQTEIDSIRDKVTEIDSIRDKVTEIDSIRDKLTEMDSIRDKGMISLKEGITSDLRDLASVEVTNFAEQLHTELHSLHSISQFHSDFKQNQADVNELTEGYDKLTADQTHLKTEVNDLQKDHENLHRDMGTIRTDQWSVKEDLTELRKVIGMIRPDRKIGQADVTNEHTDMDTVRTDHKTDQTDLARLQKDHVDSVLTEQGQGQQMQDTVTSDEDTWETTEEQMTTSLRESLWEARSDITALRTALRKAGMLLSAGRLDKASKQFQAMRFLSVEINEGAGYDRETGVFTAPHAGLYFITADVQSGHREQPVYGNIMVDGDLHCVVREGRDGGSGCVMLPLAAGRMVWVRADSPVDHYTGLGWTLFSVTLVLPYLGQ